MKITKQIKLDVFDVENKVEAQMQRQEIKVITIESEAFDITVEFKFPDNNQDNLLEFGSVRVGDHKDCNFTLKNVGPYKIKYNLVMKKKQFKECFRIDPASMELDPNQSKEVCVRFSSNKELNMKTTRETTDITCEILEGKTLELYKPVPINVGVNAVYSKYSVLPLKNINFGPIQFNESKMRQFEIKNEGMFEFNFTIFDFLNEEFRKQLKAEQEKEREEKLQAQLLMPSQLAAQLASDKDKKKGKDAPKKEVKADVKKGKGKDAPVANQLKVGQWTITPNVGTVAPDSSVLVEVVFQGNGQKLYEQKLAVDIVGRDPEDQPSGVQYELVSESCIPGIITESYETIFEEQVVVASQQSSSNITNLINSNVFFAEEKVFNFGTLVYSKHADGIVEKFKIVN